MYDPQEIEPCGPMFRTIWRTKRASGWPAITRTAAPSTKASAISWRRWTKLELADDTVLVFASDHGDMLGSQG